jgi:DICT domain-containing protein
MATKSELIEDPRSCLNEAGADEPLFLLRAQDRFFPAAVEAWVHEAELAIAAGEGSPGLIAKVREARALLRQADRWPTKKVPD